MLPLIGLLCLVSNNIVLYITFLHAYFFNNYMFSFSINRFGEAHIEFILLPIMLFLGIYGVYLFIKTIPGYQNNVDHQQPSQYLPVQEGKI